MTKKSLAGIAAALLVTHGLLGCSSPASSASSSAPSPLSPSSPSLPSITSPPNPGSLVLFKDPLTGVSTSDVRDAQDHVVQFTTSRDLIWVDGTHLPGHDAGQSDQRLQTVEPSCQCWLVVRFGAMNGQRRAYLTADVGHSNPGTLVELATTGSTVVVSWSDRFPPGTYTLSGVVTQVTTAGLVPVENAELWRLDEEQSGWDHTATDKNGFYQIHGLSDGSRRATLIKDGQQFEQGTVTVHGDTRFDIQLSGR